MIGNAIAGLYGVGVTPSTTAYESIATVTVGSGGASDITFSSIPSTYKHLQIRGIIQNASANPVVAQFNGDTNYVNYSSHALYGTGSAAGAFADIGASYPFVDLFQAPTSTQFAVGIVDILDYASTNKNKTVRTLGGWDGNGSGFISLMSGSWMNSSTAISSILIKAGSGNLNQYSSFALYGIKGA